ncbi:MAG TPA: hypothetical protein VNG89_20520 [Vicinamibacterales bacterium]|nr:hypothetical protein [Vicinamibacterales bacterium]
MRVIRVLSAISIAASIAAAAAVTPGQAAGQQQPPTVQMPRPGVPQIMTLEGNFVRVAYNNEGYVILGYQLANRSVGEPWMLLEVGLTVMDRVPDYTLMRDALSLETPDGKTVPLPTTSEYRQAEGSVQALQNREKVQRDSINYFPPSASQGCRLGFFADLGAPAMAWDQVELSSRRACLGRLYFQVPGGITYGQYWLNVKFAEGLVRVPFRILTKDEEKLLSKNFKSIKKQVDAAFRPKKG